MIKNKIQILRFIFAFFAVFAMLNCSKDDSNNNNEPTNNEAVEANRYESILIKVPNMELSQNQYEATFGSLNIQVIKVDSNTLTFMIPADAALGNTQLHIPDLNNTTLTYNVSQPSLVQTPQETVAPLLSKFETFFSDLDTPTLESGIAKNNYLQFKNYWNSTATAIEKEQIALWYQTNKNLIDEIFYLKNTIVSKTMSTNSKTMTTISFGSIFGFQKHIVGRLVTIVGAGLLATALTATTIAAGPVLLGVAVVGIGIKKCHDGNDEILNDIRKQLNIATDGLTGTTNRMLKNPIALISDELYPTSFQIESSTISQEDNSSSNKLLKEYFSTTSILNNAINEVDKTIDWANSKKATSYQPFDEVVIPANSTDEMLDITPEIMQGIKFSISHPNLQLISATLATDGQLNLKVKMVGNPITNPIVSTLNYSYSDEISDFSGHFAITVGDPDKVLHYNLTLDGVNYSGVKNLYIKNGSYEDGESWFNYNSDQTTYDVSFVFGANRRIYFRYIDLPPSGNFNLSSSIRANSDDVNQHDYSPDYLTAKISKNGITSFTFSEIYKKPLPSKEQINVSGSITVE